MSPYVTESEETYNARQYAYNARGGGLSTFSLAGKNKQVDANGQIAYTATEIRDSHNHDNRYLQLTGGTIVGSVHFAQGDIEIHAPRNYNMRYDAEHNEVSWDMRPPEGLNNCYCHIWSSKKQGCLYVFHDTGDVEITYDLYLVGVYKQNGYTGAIVSLTSGGPTGKMAWSW